MLFDKKLLTVFVVGFLGVTLTTPPTSTNLDNQAQINFHLVSKDITGSISGLTTYSYFDPENLHISHVKAEVDVNTLTTGNFARDLRFLSKRFLHKKKYPSIVFESTKIVAIENSFLIVGNLTIKDITKTVSFTITQVNNTIVGATSINLDDFNMGLSDKRFENKLDIHLKIPYEFQIPLEEQVVEH